MSTDDKLEIPTSKWPAKNREEVRLIGICDPHMSPHNPASYKKEYWEILKDSLNQVMKFAVAQEVDAVVWAGDIFHLKDPKRCPLHFLAEVSAFFRRLKEKELIPQIGIAGNHDVKFGSLKGITGQPLNVLMAAGLYELLDEQEWLFTGTNFSVRVAGSSYLHGQADLTRDKRAHGATYLLSTGHFWFGTQTGELFGEKIYSPEFLETGQPDVYLIGHHHEDQGVHQVRGKWYVAHGSITRTGSHANDLTRRPAAAYLQFRKDSIKITSLRPKCPTGEEIIDLEKREQQKQEEREMDEFVEQLREARLEGADPTQMVEQMEAANQVKTRAKEYLEKAEGISR